jgi:flagellin-like hook-associated protein FlgL
MIQQVKVSETIRAQIRGLAQSQRNIQDGIVLLKKMKMA